jgi:triacylglycerol esterase/lipase EstA (alpha/beta hydrolase family)
VLGYVASLAVSLASTANADSGPALTVPESELAAAMACPSGLTHPDGPIVVFVHGTGSTSDESYNPTFAKSLPAVGLDGCTVQMPNRAESDIQISAEYVVYAVRTLAAQTGRRLVIVGHSQGGLEPRWAARWWPDVRELVDDIVTLATPNQGTVVADAACANNCTEAIWQQRYGSNFTKALNRVAAPGPVSYTAVYSQTDEIIQPALPEAVGAFAGASNIAIQGICPGRPVHHVQPLFDAVAFAIFMDAVLHDGAADAARIDRASCLQMLAPGIGPDVWLDDVIGYSNAIVQGGNYPAVDHEPELKPYAREG